MEKVVKHPHYNSQVRLKLGPTIMQKNDLCKDTSILDVFESATPYPTSPPSAHGWGKPCKPQPWEVVLCHLHF